MKHSAGRVFFLLGAVCFAAALLVVIWNFSVELRGGDAAETVLEEMREIREEAAAEPSPSPTAWTPSWTHDDDEDEAEPPEMPTVEIDGRTYIGTLTFPTLELELPVLSELSYEGLDIAPCRYEGSVYEDNLVIAAHNYSTHFGRLSSMDVGDPVLFTDAAGTQYLYSVADFEVVDRDGREEMLSGDWDLTLFTCTVGGRTRFAVRCELAADETQE